MNQEHEVLTEPIHQKVTQDDLSTSSAIFSPLSSPSGSENSEWSVSATKLLLDKYENYLPQVGSMKKLKKKKEMWCAIANDVDNILKVLKSPIQCENRYKTVLKRKKKVTVEKHRTSGPPVEIPFQDEIDKINAIYVTIEPEVRIDSHHFEKKNHKAYTKKDAIKETLLQIHMLQEEGRERRHREQLEVIQKMLEKFLKSNKQ